MIFWKQVTSLNLIFHDFNGQTLWLRVNIEIAAKDVEILLALVDLYLDIDIVSEELELLLSSVNRGLHLLEIGTYVTGIHMSAK